MLKVFEFFFCAVLALGALFLIGFFCCQICAYKQYKKRTIDFSHQKMNYEIFVSTYRLFPERYNYYCYKGDLIWLTYKIISAGIHPFFPDTKEYYILLNFRDWFRVNEYLLKKEDEKKKQEVSDRETNAVLEDLQHLCRQEIEKAEREVSDALGEMRRITNNKQDEKSYMITDCLELRL